jgi:deoxycytidine triphosphate deaminase
MILSNVEVFAALDSGRLVIEPQPRPRHPGAGDAGDYCPYDTHAVDLSLGSEITVPETGTYAYDLTQATPLAVFIERNSRRYSIDQHSHFVLERQQFILAQTREKVHLPIDHEDNRKTQSLQADWAIDQALIRCGIGRSDNTSALRPSSSSA